MKTAPVATSSRLSTSMSKRDCFTTITPLPPQVRRETVLAFLQDYEAMIDLNPLVTDRWRIPAPEGAVPDEANCIWYKLTDAIAMPWSSSSSSTSDKPAKLKQGNISYTCVFHPLPDGLQTHCRAPLGVDIRDRWTVAGTLPDEPRQPIELGLLALGAPATGLYLREDVDLRCNRLMAGFVKKTLKKSHATLVERLSADLEIDEGEANTEAEKNKRESLSNSAEKDSIAEASSICSNSFSASRLSTPQSMTLSLPRTPSPSLPNAYPLRQQHVQANYQSYRPSSQQHQQLQHSHHYSQHGLIHHPHMLSIPPYPHQQQHQHQQHYQPAHYPAEQPAGSSSPKLWLFNSQEQDLSWSHQRVLQPQHFLQPHLLQQPQYQPQQPQHRPTASLGSHSLYPHPLHIGRPRSSPNPEPSPQQQSVTPLASLQKSEQESSQATKTHPDYPVMNPYEGDDGEEGDSPILGAEWRRPQPLVFAELE